METVTIAEAWPHYGQEFTIEDLDKMPDDGHRYELLDGTLIVSPAPGLPHQRVVAALIAVLESAVTRHSMLKGRSGRRSCPAVSSRSCAAQIDRRRR
jgi:Uma2 family endonuclease